MMRILLVGLLMTVGYVAGYNACDLAWRAETLETNVAQLKADRQEEHRQADAINRIDHETQTQLEQARADAAAAAGTSDRLRKELAASTARYQSELAAERKARTDAGLLYAELFRRANDRAEQLAGYADRSTINLNACIRSYWAISSESNEKSR